MSHPDYKYSTGLSNVGSYQASGKPYVSGEGHYFEVGASSANGGTQASARLELKVTELYLSGSEKVDVVAGLTGIEIARLNAISPSGSNWSGSLGVG